MANEEIKSDKLKVLTFKHNYVKLHYPVFPTVRGKTKYNEFDLEEKIRVIIPGGEFQAVLMDKSKLPLYALSRQFIYHDSLYRIPNTDNYVECKTLKDYIELLNSLIPSLYNFKYTQDSVVSIFWFYSQRHNWLLRTD